MHFGYPPNTRDMAPISLLRSLHRAFIHGAKDTRFILCFDSAAITEPISVRNFQNSIARLVDCVII